MMMMMIFREINAVLLVVVLVLLSITISHGFVIVPTTTTTIMRPVRSGTASKFVPQITNGGVLSELSSLDASADESEAVSEAADNDGPSSISTKLKPKEKRVYTMLKELSDSNLPFRIVVVGNGAILESTNLLGGSPSPSPNSTIMKLNQSPVSGANIVTFASEDKSFEFHLMIAKVDKVALIEKDSPINNGKTMRIIRFINNDDGSGSSKSICSLIIATGDDDHADAANEWFKIMTSKYGSEHTF
jgi:hypothetical protein